MVYKKHIIFKKFGWYTYFIIQLFIHNKTNLILIYYSIKLYKINNL